MYKVVVMMYVFLFECCEDKIRQSGEMGYCYYNVILWNSLLEQILYRLLDKVNY